jgi:putative DNA methylase
LLETVSAMPTRKLIEVALPLEAINTASAREKSIRHGHPSTLHLWWARRPLAACRAVLFASLVDDPSSHPDRFPTEEAQQRERERLFGIIERLVKWENSTNEHVLREAREEILKHTNGNPPPVYDPFAGGGSIPLEAQRLGLEAHASDLNPVAVLINKALIEIPPRFANMPPVNPESRKQQIENSREELGNSAVPSPISYLLSPTSYKGAAGLAADVRYYGKWMRDEAEKRIGHLYPKVRLPKEYGGGEATVIAWLWARTVKCPNPACGAQMPLVRSFELSKKKGREAWVEPVIEHGTPPRVRFTVKRGVGKPQEGTVGRRGARCLCCGTPVMLDHVRIEGRAGRMGAQMMAIVAEGKHGRIYLPPSEEQEQIAASAQPAWAPDTDLPEQALGFRVQNYGLTKHRELFTQRQLTALTTFSDLVGEARALVLRNAWESHDAWERGRPALDKDDSRARRPRSQEADLGARASRPQKVWHRTYLPHFEAGETPQHITFRLADSLPATILAQWEAEFSRLSKDKQDLERRKRIEAYLDAGHGSCALRDPQIAELVENALRYFDGTRYQLHQWVIMPNHVHVLITPLNENSLSSILHAWKSYTAKEANRILGRTGAFWQADYFDRVIRNEQHWNATVAYIHENPVRAGLCAIPEEWRFGSAWEGGRDALADSDPRAGRPRSQEDDALDDALDVRAGRPRSQEGDSGATAYADAVATYLALSISKAADLASTQCHWQSNPQHLKIAPTFARHALSMNWDYAEGNPFSDSSGNFWRQIELIDEVLVDLGHGQEGEVIQKNASRFGSENKPNIIISTDPPYYDNVPYADLSDFFYIWLRHSLREVYPDLFGTLLVPKAQELVAEPFRHGGREAAQRFFEEGLLKVFERIRLLQHADYPLTVYYAFKQAEGDPAGSAGGSPAEDDSDDAQVAHTQGIASTGWETMLQGLIQVGFGIVGTWPVRTERPGRLRETGSNALASSIVLVCRPRPEDARAATRREFLNALKAELPGALRRLQQGNIAPVDLAQAAIGPGMAVFSRYSKVVESDGSPMRVRTALQIINQELDAVLAEQEGEFDGDTRWAIAWFDQYGVNEGPYGVAETLSKAKNTSVEGMVEAGIVVARSGKVRLLSRDELPADWDPGRDRRVTVWEVAQHLVHALDKRGEGGAAALLAQLGGEGEIARDLAYRLYTTCERKGWAQEALAYNSLVVAWPEIRRLAAEAQRGGAVQGRMEI